MRRLTIERTAIVLLFVVVALIGIRPTVDADLWWHLASGRWMAEHHAVIGADPFSWSAASVTRVPADWLGQLAFWAVWSIAGLTGIVLFVAAIAVGGTVAVYRACAGPTLVKVGVVALATMAASVFWSSRPQMFTFAFTAVTVLVLRRRRDDPDSRRLWLLVPLFVVWANTHAGIVFGFIVLAAFVLGEVIDRTIAARRAAPGERGAATGLRSLVTVALACLAAPLASAGGAALYALPFRQVEINAVVIEEYQPPSIVDPSMWPFFGLLAVTVGLLVRGRRHLRTGDVLIVLVVGLLALRFTRAVSFFAVVAAPIVCDQASRWIEARRSARGPSAGTAGPYAPPVRQSVLVLAMVATMVMAAVGVVNRVDQAHTDVEVSFPVETQRWLKSERPPGRMFNRFSWGGYLQFYDPSMPVSIDGRNDLYDEQLHTYARIATTSGDWGEELDRQGVNTVVMPTESRLAVVLAGRPGWRVARRDAVATVVVRDLPLASP